MTRASALLAGSAAALLCLAGCRQQENQPTDTNAAAEANGATDANALDETATPETASGTTADPGTESADGRSAAPVAVVAPPPPPPDAPASAAAPLAEAATITQTIAQGSGIERVPYQGGWAWRQDGHIVRTASADGRRVSYFRKGEQTPFLVQQDKRAVALSGGKVQRAYTPQGRPETPDASTQRTGEQLARQAEQDRTRATEVAAKQPGKVQKERPSRTSGQTRSSTDNAAGSKDRTSTRDNAATHDANDASAPTNQDRSDSRRRTDRSGNTADTNLTNTASRHH